MNSVGAVDDDDNDDNNDNDDADDNDELRDGIGDSRTSGSCDGLVSLSNENSFGGGIRRS